MGGNPIQFDFTIIATLLSLFFFLFVLYIIVIAIRYFKRKEATEKELLHKLDELIKLQTQQSNKKS